MPGRPVLLIFLLLLLTMPVWGQQLPVFTQYREHHGYINPAAVSNHYFGYLYDLNVGLSFRGQWFGVEGSPKVYLAHGEHIRRLPGKVNLMMGANLIGYDTDPISFQGGNIRLGGILSRDPYKGGLVIGLSFGAVQYRVETDKIQLRQPNDNLLAENNPARIFPDVGAGIFYYKHFERGWLKHDNIYAGLSIPQVLGMSLDFRDAGSGEFALKRIRHFYAQAGWYKYLNEATFLEPSVWIKYVPHAPLHVDLNLRMHFSNYFWIGGGTSSAGALHFETGIQLGAFSNWANKLQIGYGFDTLAGKTASLLGTSHELNIAYSLDTER